MNWTVHINYVIIPQGNTPSSKAHMQRMSGSCRYSKPIILLLNIWRQFVCVLYLKTMVKSLNSEIDISTCNVYRKSLSATLRICKHSWERCPPNYCIHCSKMETFVLFSVSLARFIGIDRDYCIIDLTKFSKGQKSCSSKKKDESYWCCSFAALWLSSEPPWSCCGALVLKDTFAGSHTQRPENTDSLSTSLWLD